MSSISIPALVERVGAKFSLPTLADGESEPGLLRRTPGSPWTLGVVDQVIVSAGNYLNGLVIARLCTQAEFGLFALGSTVVLFLLDIQASLVSTPQAIRDPGVAATEQKRFTGSTLVHQCLLGLVCAGLLGALTALVTGSPVVAPGLSAVLTVIAIFSLFILLREYWRRLFLLRRWMAQVVAFDAAFVVVQVGALYAATRFGTPSASVGYAIIGLVCAFFAITPLFALRSEFNLSWASLWPDFTASFRTGRWILINSLTWSVGNYAYPWILAAIHGPKATGIWAACMGVVAIVNIALVGILNTLTPQIARAHVHLDHGAFRAYLRRTCKHYAAVTLLVACIPAVFGGALATFMYGPEYGGTHFVVAVLALNAVFGAVTGCYGRALMVAGHANWDFAVNLSSLIVLFSLGWLLTRHLGPLGAAVSLSTANGLGALLRVTAFESFAGSAAWQRENA